MPQPMTRRDRWKVVLILLRFIQEADDATLVRVAEFAAQEMVKA